MKVCWLNTCAEIEPVIRLPIHPKLRIQLNSEFSSELVRRVIAGDLNLALVCDGISGKLSDHGCGIRSDASLCRTPADPRSGPC